MRSYPAEDRKTKNTFGFALLMVYLFFEYGRPQALIPVLGYLRPGIVLIGLMGIYLVATRNVRFESVQSKCMLGFLILSAIHVPIAVNNYWAFQGAKGFLIYLILFLSITSFVNSYERLSRFIKVWIAINLVCAAIGLKHGGRVPDSAFMGDENDFALVMNMAIPFAYFMSLSADSKSAKIFYLAASGCFIAAGVASLSRGGFVGLVPVILYCWLKTPKKMLATIIIGTMVGVLYLTAPAAYWNEVKTIMEEVEDIKADIKGTEEDKREKGTGAGRWYAWKIGWQMFLDQPMIGVGPGNYPWHSGKYQPDEDLKYRAGIAGRAVHSIYFTLMPELGVAGILFFSIMLYHSYRDSSFLKNHYLPPNKSNKLRFMNSATKGALLAYLISGAFLSTLYYPHLWLLVSLSVSSKYIGLASARMTKK